jgi:hypothetical protein
MIADPAFVAAARQVRLDINPKTGAAVQAAVNAVAQVPADVLKQTAAILKW